MPRVSRIKYNSALSVAENAAKSGVSEAAVRYYIKAHHLDRRHERKQNIIDDCKKYLKKHPEASKVELQRETGHSVSTITRYWSFITTKNSLTDFNQNKIQKKYEKEKESLKKISTPSIQTYLSELRSKERREIKRNKKPLWSEILPDIPQLLSLADTIDISALSAFLTEKPEMPMLFVGSGGSGGALPALLYGMKDGIGKAITPLQFASLSDSAIKHSRVLLLSKSGRNDDILYAGKRATILNADNTACLTLQDSDEDPNELKKVLEKANSKVFLFNQYELEDGFTSLRSKFFMNALLYRAFTGESASILNASVLAKDCFTYTSNDEESEPVAIEKIEHFIVLYSGFGEPVAYDIESAMTEIGAASVQVCDLRNYCHGRFIFAGNHTQNKKEPTIETNTAIVFLATPKEQTIIRNIRKLAVAPKTPIITISTEQEGAKASLELMLKTNVLTSYICEQGHKINPNSPPNYSDIDKRAPRSISFTAAMSIRKLSKKGNN